MVRQSQTCGYGISQSGIVPGVSAFAVPVRDAHETPFAAISVVGPSESFPSARIADVIAMLEHEAHAIGREALRILG